MKKLYICWDNIITPTHKAPYVSTEIASYPSNCPTLILQYFIFIILLVFIQNRSITCKCLLRPFLARLHLINAF